VVAETNPSGGVTAYTYDSNGYRNTTTDPNGNVTTRTFDTNGNVLSESNGEGHTQYFTYDQFNNVIESRDARSTSTADDRYRVTTTWTGVTRNRLSESTPPTAQQPSGTTRSWSYSAGTEPAIGGGVTPTGLLLSEVDAKGATTTYRYDSAGNLRKMTDRAALVTEYTYDELGRRVTTTVVSDTFPAGVVTLAGYDALGNIVRETGPPVTNTVTGMLHRRETVTAFDPAANVSTITVSDLGGSASPDTARVTSYLYDRADRLLSTTDADGGIATQVYDGAGNVVSTVDEAGRRVDFGYDARNLQVSATGIGLVTDEGATPRNVSLGSTVYDAGGRPTESVDSLGRVTRTVYDRADRPVSVTRIGYVDRDGTSRDIVLEATTYDAAGFPVQVVTGGGQRTVAQTFDESGRQVSATLDPAGLNRVSATLYDANGNTVSSTLTAGAVTEQTRYSYDPADRVLSETVENGTDDLTTTYTYDQRGVATSRVEPRGNAPGATAATFQVDYTADELGRAVLTQSPPVSVTDAGVTTTGVRPSVRVGYDTFGSVTHRVDERGDTTTHRFDRLGREVEIEHPTYTPASTGVAVVPTELFVYDRVGNLTSRTDRRGRTTTFAFDGLNRIATQTDPAIGTNTAGVWRWFYDDAGNNITQIDPRGARIESTFDHLDRQRTNTTVVRNATATPDRYTTTFDFDDLNNTTYQMTPTGDVSAATYSPASEQLTVTDPAGNVTTTSYDLAARPIATVDPLGRRSTTTFDLAGRAVKTERFTPTGTLLTTATTGYDRAGNVTSITSPRGNVTGATAADFTTTFSFDPIGRLTTVVEPTSATASITTSYAYDAAGNQTALTDGRGNTTQYGYNPWNLQSSVIEPSTAAHPTLADRTWTNEFDAGGLAVRSTEPGGVVIQRTFDELGRLVTETGVGPTAAPTATRTFGYDAAGFMTQAGSPTGTIGFSYDDRGLLTASTGPAAYAGTFTYDASGRLTARSNTSASTSITWNSRSLPATVTDTLSATTATHTYDAAAQRISTTYTGGGIRSYEYDNLGRLTSDTLRSSTNVVSAGYEVGYDVDSNIVSRTVTLPANTQAGANTYTYDNTGRITSWTKPATTTPLTYTWDAAGNLTNNAGQAQSFDQRNRMLTAGDTTYTWTPRSTMATQQNGTAAATTFTFDGLGRQTTADAETYTYDSLDRVAAHGSTTFAYLGTELDPVGVGTTLFTRGANAEPIAAKIGTAAATLIGLDPHGDASYQFGGDSTVSATRVYDPMGTTLATTGTFTTIGFQGDYTDPTTADVWMGARWYRPGTGNFVSRDTIFGALDTPISLNRYTYAQGDPLGMWDPDGRFAIPNPFKRIEDIGSWVADTLDVGEGGSRLQPVDTDGAMVASIDEVLANPDLASSGARLSHAQDAFKDLGKSLLRSTIASTYTAFSGRDIETLDRVSNLTRGIAIAETAVSYGGAAITLGAGVTRASNAARSIEFPELRAPRSTTQQPAFKGRTVRELVDEAKSATTQGIDRVVHELNPKTPLTARDSGHLQLGSHTAPSSAIEVHPFSGGASHITTTRNLERFPGSTTFGGEDGLFVAPTRQIDDLLASGASRSQIEAALGLNNGSLRGGDLVRIDITDPFERGLRLPDPKLGNIHHRPGTGLTTGNIYEALIDSPLQTDPRVRARILGGRP
jgi:RHS repeat-associated protein